MRRDWQVKKVHADRVRGKPDSCQYFESSFLVIAVAVQ